MQLFCKLCGVELVEFGHKFLTHKYYKGKCHVYFWLKTAYPEELKKEESNELGLSEMQKS